MSPSNTLTVNIKTSVALTMFKVIRSDGVVCAEGEFNMLTEQGRYLSDHFIEGAHASSEIVVVML